MKWTYDGTFNGLLSAVFEWYERRPGPVTLAAQADNELFNIHFKVHTDEEKANRVRAGYTKRLDKTWNRKLHCCWLSESEEGHNHIFQLLIALFATDQPIYKNYGDAHVVGIAKLAKSVEREKHRMEAFIRFQKMDDGLFFAKVEPDFNVLPLIMTHFKNRYTDQPWLIYDLRRNYGLYYNLEKVEPVVMDKQLLRSNKAKLAKFDATESLYDQLWKDYFKSTNIEERKNTKLHLQHVPKRYHQYLTELHS